MEERIGMNRVIRSGDQTSLKTGQLRRTIHDFKYLKVFNAKETNAAFVILFSL